MRGFVVAIIVALALQPRANAEPKEDAALLHLDRGIAAFEAKDFATAEREFAAAHRLVPDKANPYRWLALTEIQLGDCKRAVEHIDGFLSRVPPTDARVAEMTRWREFCRREAQPQSQGPPTQGQGPPTQGQGPPAQGPVTPAEPQVTGTQGLAQPAPVRDDKPLHARWWFWPAVGTLAVVITGATIYAVTRTDETMLPSVQCDATGCR
jgi:tetratricopeptide (TPR) repeat protein